MKRTALALVLAAACLPALPGDKFELEPICDGQVLQGLRGQVPRGGGYVTIYIPAGLCEGRRPQTRMT